MLFLWVFFYIGKRSDRKFPTTIVERLENCKYLWVLFGSRVYVIIFYFFVSNFYVLKTHCLVQRDPAATRSGLGKHTRTVETVLRNQCQLVLSSMIVFSGSIALLEVRACLEAESQ